MTNIWLNIIKPKRTYAKWLIFLTLLSLMILGSMGYFHAVRDVLDTEALTFSVGAYSVSAYMLSSATITIALVFWITAIASDVLEERISRISGIGSSNRALILKITQIVIYLIAILFSLDFVGVDLTTLTVFSGALGIGLGFGLQKVASNFISGLILLMEKSLEDGDLIELADGTFGFIRKSSARFTLIETFDGREILIPNEDLITSRVVNWTYSNTKGRVEIKIGISYDSDLEKASELILQAATEHPSCILDPEPKCFHRNYGDSSVDFILHFWVDDVTIGRWQPQSEVLFSIWKKFKEGGIQMPYPQRDLHLKSPAKIQVTTDDN